MHPNARVGYYRQDFNTLDFDSSGISCKYWTHSTVNWSINFNFFFHFKKNITILIDVVTFSLLSLFIFIFIFIVIFIFIFIFIFRPGRGFYGKTYWSGDPFVRCCIPLERWDVIFYFLSLFFIFYFLVLSFEFSVLSFEFWILSLKF